MLALQEPPAIVTPDTKPGQSFFVHSVAQSGNKTLREITTYLPNCKIDANGKVYGCVDSVVWPTGATGCDPKPGDPGYPTCPVPYGDKTTTI